MKKSCRTPDDVATMLALPVLAVVPVMWTAWERSQRRRRRLALVLAAVTAAVVCGAAAAWMILG
jgi:glucose-6-phosphate-specific signal transduction histidine kinase